jgi:Protein of unknown function (DUF1573)
MLSKKITFLCFLLFFCCSIFAQKTAKKTASAAASALRFEEINHEIGFVKRGEILVHKFKFTNVSKRPIEVKNATATCGCTVPDYPFIPIMPNESGEIGVTFNTTSKLGHQKPTITITTSAGIYKVSLEGTVTE